MDRPFCFCQFEQIGPSAKEDAVLHFFFAGAFTFLAAGILSFRAFSTLAAAAAAFFAVAALRFARVSLLLATVFVLLVLPLRRDALLVVMF